MSGLLIVDTVAVLCAVFFLTSPVKQAFDVLETPSNVQYVNPVNLHCFLLNCATQLGYGIFMPVAPVVPCNAYGFVVGLVCLSVCWRFAWREEKAHLWNWQASAGTLLAVVLSGLIIAYAGLGGPDAPTRVGRLGMLAGIMMYAAPLSALQEVLRTKSSKTLPVMQVLLGLLNSMCWFVVGISRQKMPVWLPNILGMLLALIQLGLILKYPSEVAANVEEVTAGDPYQPLKLEAAEEGFQEDGADPSEDLAEEDIPALLKNGIFEVGTNAATEHDEQNEHVQRQNEKEFAKKKIALEMAESSTSAGGEARRASIPAR